MSNLLVATGGMLRSHHFKLLMEVAEEQERAGSQLGVNAQVAAANKLRETAEEIASDLGSFYCKELCEGLLKQLNDS